jgi:PAS domain S-box-containing protein
LQELAWVAARSTGAPLAVVSLVDVDVVRHVGRFGDIAADLPRDESFCAHTVAAAEPGVFMVRDARSDLRFAGLPLVAGGAHMRSYAGAPIVTSDGHAIGAVAVLDVRVREFDADEERILGVLARQAMDQLELRYSATRLAREIYTRRSADFASGGSEGGAAAAATAAAAAGSPSTESPDKYEPGYASEVLQRQALAIETTSDGIAIYDADEHLVYANDASARIHGFERGSDLAGFTWRALYSEDEQRRFDQTILPALRRDRRWRGEAIGRRRDGTMFPHEMSLALLDGGGVVAVLRDVSERHALDKMKNEFVSTVSHELRTPLTSIRGSLGLLEGGVAGTLPDKARELIRIARSNADRLIRLINDILDLDKMESGRLELAISSLEPSEVVTATLEGIQGMADQRGVRLVARIGKQARFLGDRDRVIQVLTNLVSNAIKFSPEHADVTVRVVTGEGGFLRFSVEDQGMGIPREMVGRLFKKFAQLDASDARGRGGTGLGLVISRSIIEQHGGTIGVNSEPGLRTQFWFELPLAPAERTSLPPVPTTRAHTVLLVEDDDDLADILTILLSKEGYHTVHASSIDDAWRIVIQSRPSAMLLDLLLPDGSGLELINRLRAHDRTRTLPVVILSGREPEGAVLNSGLIDWLTKPFDEQRLYRALRRAVRTPGSPRALVVDDDTATRTILVTRLRALGIDCIEAMDGLEALRVVREQVPDLIVLDVGMPGMDGFEFVRTLRQEQARAVPLVVYTGRDLTAAERKVLTLGPSFHLTKARVSEDEFVRIVREVLEGLLPRAGGAGGGFVGDGGPAAGRLA